MTNPLLITICSILLIAYLFDLTARRTRVPSVLLFLALGLGVRGITESFNIEVPSMHPILPVFGTIGLILIVLEGSLELDLNRKKLPLVWKSSLMALLPILLLAGGMTWVLHQYFAVPVMTGIANALPLSVISSAIAIPTAQQLPKHHREFVTYESSLSDIFGVILFNFITLNDSLTAGAFLGFGINLILMLIITVLATLLLTLILSRIQHRIKYLPILLMVILVYSVAKIYHLPALIFVLILGIVLGNAKRLIRFDFVAAFRLDRLQTEVHRFHELTTEFAFLIRATFFILFGYLLDRADLMQTDTLSWSLSITAAIFVIRAVFLVVLRLPLMPLLFVAPRGLITILLFVSIPATLQYDGVNRTLITQVIVLTAVILMAGTMVSRGTKSSALSEGTPSEPETH